MKTLPWITAAACAIALLAACQEEVKVEPAPTAETVEGQPQTVRETAAGVTMKAFTGPWEGEAKITEELTPIKVTIQNESGHPLRVSYDSFTLVNDEEGDVYAALAPVRFSGEEVDKLDLKEGVEPVTNPGWVYEDFEVAPYYSPLYPEMAVYRDRDFYWDPAYRSHYNGMWDEETELPTAEMLVRAIPEGVVNDGGRLEGWLYFEELGDDNEPISFRADLVNAETGDRLGEIRIPLETKEVEEESQTARLD